MRWTAENDQNLLLMILLTSSINVNAESIASQWPSNDEKPTPRAIKERIARIRSDAAKRGFNDLKAKGSESTARKPAGITKTPASTPRKPGTPTSSAKKRPHSSLARSNPNPVAPLNSSSDSEDELPLSLRQRNRSVPSNEVRELSTPSIHSPDTHRSDPFVSYGSPAKRRAASVRASEEIKRDRDDDDLVLSMIKEEMGPEARRRAEREDRSAAESDGSEYTDVV